MNFEIKNKKIIKYYGVEKEVVIPFGVTTIGERAFEDTEIESVIISNSVTQIENYAFLGCENIKYIEIPDNVEDIGDFTFAYCENLEIAKMPRRIFLSLVFEHPNVFLGCNKLIGICDENGDIHV